jgi:glycosyltransferase involved in cell wall biosynthesis
MAGPRVLVWFWSGGGGGSRYAVNLARRLDVRFGGASLSLRADDRSETGGDLSVLRADVVSARKRPLATLLDLAKGRRVLAEHVRAARADIVVLAMNFAAAAPLSESLRKPLVYVAHDPDPHPGDYAEALQRWTQRFLLARAEATIAASAFAAERLRGRVREGRLHTAPLEAVLRPGAARGPLRPEAPVRFLLLGRLLAYKGLDLLEGALQRIASRTDWRLSIAGFGDEAAARAFARFVQIDAIEARRLADAEVDALIARHDVLLAPYLSATQSGVVADASAQGMPAVATPVGALPEQLDFGKAGWLAEAASAEAYAAALVRALDARASYAEMSARAFARAQRCYGTDYWDWMPELVR